jgi:hypothetical protein
MIALPQALPELCGTSTNTYDFLLLPMIFNEHLRIGIPCGA